MPKRHQAGTTPPIGRLRWPSAGTAEQTSNAGQDAAGAVPVRTRRRRPTTHRSASVLGAHGSGGDCSAVLGCSGTMRDLWNFVSRMCSCGGLRSSLTSPAWSRMASPTRSPVLARRPIRVDKVWGRNDPRGRLAWAASKRAVSCAGVKRYGLGRRGLGNSAGSGTSVSGAEAWRYARNLRAILRRRAAPPGPWSRRSGRPTRALAGHGSGRYALGLSQTPRTRAGESSRRASGTRALRVGSDTPPIVCLRKSGVTGHLLTTAGPPLPTCRVPIWRRSPWSVRT